MDRTGGWATIADKQRKEVDDLRSDFERVSRDRAALAAFVRERFKVHNEACDVFADAPHPCDCGKSRADALLAKHGGG